MRSWIDMPLWVFLSFMLMAVALGSIIGVSV
jgi:hypothetical protein